MQTVGEILRSEREKKGLSVKDIEDATSIRALYLSAIEDGDYSVVPGDVYVKGFIRNYASFLGLDATQMVEMYRQSQAPLPEETIEEIPKEPSKVKRDSSRKKGDFGRLLMVVGIGLAVGLAWWMFAGNAEQSKPVPEQKPQAPAAAPTPPKPVTPPAPAAPTPAAKPVLNKPVVVSVKYTDRCWTLVTVDGKEVFEGTPKPGDSLTWEGDREVMVRLGNAGAADIIYNGKSAGKLGASGDVTVKTFTPTGIKP
ncbi:MAG TPA: RodZ domain-containing protein [Patescibacteria group bacterium]|nr:RodZ domain-containing protein [Patescibacteria group bacterium]